MFGVGSLIFIAYMFGLLTMINKSHKQQEKEFPIKADEMDICRAPAGALQISMGWVILVGFQRRRRRWM